MPIRKTAVNPVLEWRFDQTPVLLLVSQVEFTPIPFLYSFVLGDRKMTNTAADLRYAIRAWRKQPFSIAATILTIAVSIGATVAIFSVVNAVLIKPFPYKNQQELVVIWDNFMVLHMENLPVPPAETIDYANLTQAFDKVSALKYTEFNLLANGHSTRALGARVSSNLFSMLGSQPLLGRALLPADDEPRSTPAAVLSFALWQRMTAGNADIVGQTITANGKTYTVVGVMQKEFQFPARGVRFSIGADLWVPAQISSQEAIDRDSRQWMVFARLKPGISLARAQANMDDVARQLDRTYTNYRGPGGADGGWKITVRPLVNEIIGDGWVPLALLSGAVGFVFLIACINIAGLLLARATDRQPEITLRSTLGASRWRIMRQLLTESLLLSFVGGVLGVGLSSAVVRMLASSYADAIPRMAETGIDARALLFTLAVIILAATLFGLAPAIYLSNPNGASALARGAMRSTTAGKLRKLSRDLLAAVEVGMALILLIGAGLLIRSFQRILAVDPGFDTGRSMVFTISLPSNRYPTAKEWKAYYQQAMERIQRAPGVRMASVGSVLPLSNGTQAPFSIEGKAFDPTQLPQAVRFQSTGAAYFHTLVIPLVAGRDFTQDDIQGETPVVVVNQALAKQFFPTGAVLGSRIKIGAPTAPGSWLTIVGIAKNAKSLGLDAPDQPEMYIPFPQRPDPVMNVVIKGDIEPASLVSSIRKELESIDKEQPIYDIRTMQSMVDGSLAPRKFSMLLLTVLAGIALALAAVGLFGMISYSVAQRTREMAVRMALGAQMSQVQSMVLTQGLRPAAIGVGAGLLLAFIFSRVIASMLFGLRATDPSTYLFSTIIVIFLALLAAYLPVRRLTKIRLYSALHYE
jgi:putative ABC transport system permease protein